MLISESAFTMNDKKVGYLKQIAYHTYMVYYARRQQNKQQNRQKHTIKHKEEQNTHKDKKVHISIGVTKALARAGGMG